MLTHVSAGSVGEYDDGRGGGEDWMAGRGVYCTSVIKGSHSGRG